MRERVKFLFSHNGPMKIEQSIPAIMKISDNGQIGEARTRALLLDRFWVLTRSIDIDGADLLIQKRTTSQLTHWGSYSRPAVGRVQAKFMQDKKTSLYLNPDHVCDESGRPWPEYWLIVHSGSVSTAQIHVLSAQQVRNAATDKVIDGKPKLYLSGTEIFKNGFRVPVEQLDSSLNEMEKALDRLSYKENSKFQREIGLVPEPPSSPYMVLELPGSSAIDLEAIQRWRARVESDYWDLSWRTELLGEILSMDDLSYALQQSAAYHPMWPSSDDPTTPLYDESLERAVTHLKDQYEWLIAKNRLQTYKTLSEDLQSVMARCEHLDSRLVTIGITSESWQVLEAQPLASSFETALGEELPNHPVKMSNGGVQINYAVSLGEGGGSEVSGELSCAMLEAFLKLKMQEDPLDEPDVIETFLRPTSNGS